MTSGQLAALEAIVIVTKEGVAIAYPPAAPLVALLAQFVDEAAKRGITPAELSIEQVTAIAAGMAAARASAVTEYQARHKEIP